MCTHYRVISSGSRSGGPVTHFSTKTIIKISTAVPIARARLGGDAVSSLTSLGSQTGGRWYSIHISVLLVLAVWSLPERFAYTPAQPTRGPISRMMPPIPTRSSMTYSPGPRAGALPVGAQARRLGAQCEVAVWRRATFPTRRRARMEVACELYPATARPWPRQV